MTGTFDDWSKSVLLEKKDGDMHEKLVELPRADEKIYYKVSECWYTRFLYRQALLAMSPVSAAAFAYSASRVRNVKSRVLRQITFPNSKFNFTNYGSAISMCKRPRRYCTLTARLRRISPKASRMDHSQAQPQLTSQKPNLRNFPSLS